MIRINLLKKSLKIRHPRTAVKEHRFPIKIAGISGGILVSVCIAFFAGRVLLKDVKPIEQVPKTEKNKIPEPAVSDSRVIEDIVREQDESGDILKQNGILDLPYQQLSPAERINYELLFARNLCEVLSVAVPSGIGFKTLSAKDFGRVEGVTFTSSRELITEMLTNFRERRISPLPKPYSAIRKTESGFQFSFVADAHFGLDLRAQFVDLELKQLASRDNISFLMKKLEYVARNSNLALSARPGRLSETTEGNFLRVRYSINAVGSYADFVKFVKGLHEERIPCAFEEVRLFAQTRDRCSIECRLLFTTFN